MLAQGVEALAGIVRRRLRPITAQARGILEDPWGFRTTRAR